MNPTKDTPTPRSTDEPHEIRDGLVIVCDAESTTIPERMVSITNTLTYHPPHTILIIPQKPKEHWRKGRPMK